MFHIPAHKQGSTAPVAVFAQVAPAAVAEVVVGQRASTYRGKYPQRIKMVSGSKAAGLFLEANDGTTVRMNSETAWALCQALGVTKNGAQLGDDITPWLPKA